MIKFESLRKFVLTYVLFLIIIRSFGQSIPFEESWFNQDIPSSETYNIFQDSRGYIWFSTESGLCRLKGNRFAVYDGKKGFPEKACYGICEYPKGKLWFITSQNRILTYNDKSDSVEEAPFSDKMVELLNDLTTSQIYSIQPYQKNKLWINSQWNSFVVDLATSKVIELDIKNDLEQKFSFLIDRNQLIPIKENRPFNQWLLLEDEIEVQIINTDTLTQKIAWSNEISPQWRCLTIGNRTAEFFIGWENHLFKVKNGKITETYLSDAAILGLYVDHKNGLWVGTSKNGVLYFEDSKLQNPIQSLNGYSVTGILVDFEGGIWCSTLEKGIRYAGNDRIRRISNIDATHSKYELFKVVDNSLWYIESFNQLGKYKGGTWTHIVTNTDRSTPLRDITPFKDGYIAAGYDGVYFTDKKWQLKKISGFLSKGVVGGMDVEVTNEDRVFILQKGGLYEYTEKDGIVFRLERLPSGANCMTAIGSHLYLGCKNGLYSFNTIDFSIKRIESVEGNVSAILKCEAEKFIILTKDNGIYFIQNGKLENKTSKLNLSGIALNDICEGESGIFWLASNKGLIKIEEDKTYFYDLTDGLPSNEIYAVECLSSEVYFLTNDGCFSFDSKSQIRKISKPKLYYSNLRVNGIAWKDFSDGMQLNYHQNNLVFDFDLLTFNNPMRSKLYVKFHGEKDSVLLVQGNILELKNLQPGDYNISVWAMNDKGLKSSEPIEISFSILPPYWKTIWFLIMSVLILVLLILVIIFLSVARIRKKEREKSRLNVLIAESQLTALQAQMNPHFIFNAINSIQTFILDNETQAAYNYLARFAKLIRMVLHQAKDKLIPLDSEIELLKIYIELEQLRFKNKFDFKLIQEDDIDTTQILIPPLLIQPFIENAIWHGLMPLQEQKSGELSIEIRKIAEGTLIRIEDNGIGREESKRLKSDLPHSSVGLKITQGRLEILNSISDSIEAEIQIHDLKDQTGKPLGTRIEIEIKNKSNDNH